MPKIGEIRYALEIGYKGTNQFIWLNCNKCSKGRWVRLMGGKPVHETCTPCHNRITAELKRGCKNVNWKGGRILNSRGYIQILKPNHPYANCAGYVLEHRLVMESILGRFLLPSEEVHHVDGNPQNNVPSNLRLFTSKAEHYLFHFNAAPSNYLPGKNACVT